MKKTLQLLILLLLLGSLNTRGHSESKATASIEFNGGRAYPQKELCEYLLPGNLYRFKIFGGAKVDVKYVGAVGLGLDFTYSQHQLKELSGHYRRFTWDWIHLPVSLGFLFFNTGFSWVVTNVSIPSLNIAEDSIRPEFIFDTGLQLGIGSNFALKAGGRLSRTWIDTEPLSNIEKLRITGDFASWFAGFMLYF